MLVAFFGPYSKIGAGIIMLSPPLLIADFRKYL